VHGDIQNGYFELGFIHANLSRAMRAIHHSIRWL